MYYLSQDRLCWFYRGTCSYNGHSGRLGKVRRVAKKQAEQEAREAHELETLLSGRKNPMTPEVDVDHLYIWRAGPWQWTPPGIPEDWSMTIQVVVGHSINYWWRMRREGDDEEIEEL